MCCPFGSSAVQPAAQRGAQLCRHAGELDRHRLGPGEQEVAAAFPHGRHGETGIVAAIDHDWPRQQPLEGMPVADTGKGRDLGGADQQALDTFGLRPLERVAGLGKVGDADDGDLQGGLRYG